MEEFATPRLSILFATRPGPCYRPRHRLFRGRNRRRLRVLISRPVPPQSVLPRRHPIRRRRKFSQRQVLLSFSARHDLRDLAVVGQAYRLPIPKAAGGAPALQTAGLLQRSSEIFGGVFTKSLLQRRNARKFSGIKSRQNGFEWLMTGQRIQQA